MKLQDQVTSLELSKKLEKLGVPQVSLFYWRLGYHTSESFENGKSKGKEGHFGDYGISFMPYPRLTTADIKWNESELAKLDETQVSAFTVAEMGEIIDGWVLPRRSMDGKEWINNDEELPNYVIVNCKTEADARAKMLIYLLENKLITL